MFIPVYGSTMEWSDDGVTYTLMPKAKGIVVPEDTVAYRDVTNLDSPDRRKEYSKGLIDSGELTVSCFYSRVLYAAAKAKEAGSTPTYIRTTLPADEDQSAGDEFIYQAWVNPTLPAADVEGDLMMNIKLRPTGAVTWNEGATV